MYRYLYIHILVVINIFIALKGLFYPSNQNSKNECRQECFVLFLGFFVLFFFFFVVVFFFLCLLEFVRACMRESGGGEDTEREGGEGGGRGWEKMKQARDGIQSKMRDSKECYSK